MGEVVPPIPRKTARTEPERILLWAYSVVDGEPMKRPTDLRLARALIGFAKGDICGRGAA